LWKLKLFQSPQGWVTKEIWLAPFVVIEEFSIANATVTESFSDSLPCDDQHIRSPKKGDV
jgi:hypothetical protein